MSTNPKISAVELQRITVRYGRAVALEDVSVRIAAGELVAIVGPNGAGKSTLFNVIAGLIKPQHGRVLVEGEAPQRHRSTGYVPQRNQNDPRFPVTVRDVVMMGRTGRIGLFRWPGREDRERVHDALVQTEMLHLADRPVGALSGGQQQRVFLARALAQEARLLLLDEPLSGLDGPSQERLTTVLNKLRSQQITILMATHDLNAAAQHADTMLLLNHRVIGYGPANSLLTPAMLQRAYGSHLHVLVHNSENGIGAAGGTPHRGDGAGERVTLIADTCCSDGDAHGTVHPHAAPASKKVEPW